MEVAAASSLRDLNRAAALAAVFESGELTRNQIVSATGISSPSISRITVELLEEGLLEEGDAELREGVGRRSHPLRIARRMGHAIGLDLNVYMSRLVVTDLAGVVLASEERETPVRRSATALSVWVADWVESVAAALPESGRMLRQLVVAVPARVDPGGVVLEAGPDMAPMVGEQFAQALRTRVSAPTHLENDSTAALVSELEAGVARGVDDVVLVSVSQALTAAVAIDGRPRRGRTNAVGAVHRLRLGSDAVSDVITTTGVTRALERAGRSVSGWSELLSEQDGQDEFIAGVRGRFVEGLALVTSALCVGVDPQLVVFDGRMAPVIARTLPDLRAQLERTLSSVPRLEITTAGLYASARGAATIARDAARRDVIDGLKQARRTDRTA